jgi:hypothetical protein
MSIEVWRDAVRKKHGDRFDYSQVSFETLRDKVVIICPKPDHGPFSQRAGLHRYHAGCPPCVSEERSQDKSMSAEEWLVKAKKKHGARFRYAHAQFSGMDEPVLLTCKKSEHGDVWSTPRKHLNSSKGACPFCWKHGRKQAARDFHFECVREYGKGNPEPTE